MALGREAGGRLSLNNMANRAVKQPNGKYAQFSDVVDHFTYVNCSREELWAIYRDEFGAGIATAKLDRADASPERFSEEIATIRFRHGDAEADATAAYLSCTDGSALAPPSLREN